ncbi:hypothetical protein [Sphingomonas sp. TWP1-3-1]|uniref:hypothetical protein n=1 Tax=Sphingomonas sp. TWP1-3-1 TaxID=2804612 RepID=UPI003CF35492
MGKRHAIWLALLLTGCSTDRQLLELKRDRLLRIESVSNATLASVEQGSYDPTRYDLYLALDADIFTRVMAQIDGLKVKLEASGRPITLTVDSLAMAFRPGSPEITLNVTARDDRTGIVAKVALDSRLLLEGDLAKPDELKARIIATKLVPEFRWGFLNLTRGKFVRALLELEGSRFTDKLPLMTLPLARDFTFGNPASAVDSGQLDTGNGSWIRGSISLPSTLTKGRFVVKNVLFLNNGLHLFANVEGV